MAHRMAWELTHGPIPPGLFVCHHCDNPPCCNPVHLFLGTNADNVDDKVKKYRQAVGENHGRAKLTNSDVVEIKRLSSKDKLEPHLIAPRFRVSVWQVSRIVNKRAWKHLT
jgi:hypothetical protein